MWVNADDDDVVVIVGDASHDRPLFQIEPVNEPAADIPVLAVTFYATDREDVLIDTSDEPSHQDLCDREQAYFLKAILEDLDLTAHLSDAVNSLRIVLAADESVKTGRVVTL